MKRTHTCGELTSKHLKQKVILQGWAQSIRDHGGLLFIDLRDRYGITQVVIDPKNKAAFKVAETIKREFVVEAEGTVSPRPKEMINKHLPTGEIEITTSEIKVLNKADTPPIEIDDRKLASEDIRLQYRYLDLRRPMMQKHLLIRHKAAQAARSYLNEQHFMEIETPILIRSTPGGARNYLVPSRVNPGQFYGLAESPQVYKQLLMVAGCDRYYQIARCMRDEDLRADRQPEFTQIDIEMSFVQAEDVIAVIEGILVKMWKDVLGITIKPPFQRLTYKEAMDKYGCDKPDLRYELELKNISDLAKASDFSVFKSSIQQGGVVKAINAEGLGSLSRKQIEGEWTDFAKEHGAKGLAWMKVEAGKLDSNIVKYFSPELQKSLIKKLNAKDGDLLLFMADSEKVANTVLSQLRQRIAKEKGLLDQNIYKFCWILEFPLFEHDEENNTWASTHHVFTAPLPEHKDTFDKDPASALGTHYDVVLNGVELGSGSIRINIPELQKRAFAVIGLKEEEARKKFAFLLDAFTFGAPPHGGIALGFDRLVALMCGYNDIREVVAFPKNKKAQCPMDGCPGEIDQRLLKDAHIKVDIKAAPPKDKE